MSAYDKHGHLLSSFSAAACLLADTCESTAHLAGDDIAYVKWHDKNIFDGFPGETDYGLSGFDSLSFREHGVVTPEPETLVLMVTGLSALVLITSRKRRLQ